MSDIGSPPAGLGDRTPLAIEDVEASVQRNLARRESRARTTAVVYPLAVLAAVLAVWELGTRGLGIPEFLLPPPSAIVISLGDHWPLVLKYSWATSVEILLGYALSIAVGIPLALAIFLWPPFARAIYPLLVSSQAMPKVAIAPLFIVWFGFGLLPKVLIAFLIAFFPIVIDTAVGLAAIEPEKIYLARSMGFGGIATFFKFRLPNALPSIFGGLKIAITLAVVGAVVGEFVGGDAGLAGLTVLGVGFYLLVEMAESLAIPRHIRAASTAARESM